MFSALERLVGAVEDREGPEFVALSQVVRRRVTPYVWSVNDVEWSERTSCVHYPLVAARELPVDQEGAVEAAFPHVIVFYHHRSGSDESWKIIVRARNEPPAPMGRRVGACTVYISQWASVEDLKSNASQIVNLLSQGYAYEGDVSVRPNFRDCGAFYPLRLVQRDPSQRTWWERVKGTNTRP